MDAHLDGHSSHERSSDAKFKYYPFSMSSSDHNPTTSKSQEHRKEYLVIKELMTSELRYSNKQSDCGQEIDI